MVTGSAGALASAEGAEVSPPPQAAVTATSAETMTPDSAKRLWFVMRNPSLGVILGGASRRARDLGVFGSAPTKSAPTAVGRQRPETQPLPLRHFVAVKGCRAGHSAQSATWERSHPSRIDSPAHGHKSTPWPGVLQYG